MKVRLDTKYAAAIRKALIDNYEAEAQEGNAKRNKEKLWHVSDLVYPRKTYYDLTQGRKISDKAIGFWFTGKAYHAEMQRVLGKKYAEVAVKWEKVVAHIDHMEKVLLEIKTSRKWTIPATPSAAYTRQAGFYCAMTGKKSAKIVVVYPTAGRTWKGTKSSTVDIAAWEISFTAEELDMIREDLRITIDEIQKAVKAKSPANLPACPDWLLDEFENAETGEYDEKAEYASPFNFIDIPVEYA